jgi:predicted Zn-dependent peptidase
MPSTYKQTQLKNGLTVIGESNPANVSSAIGFFVRTGARDETPAESGLSHFLEHMMFKGTPTRSAIDINMALGNLGAQANAFTSEENTVYYAAVIPERFSEMQELLSDMLRPALDPNEFDMEKKVILEEIALYQDRPHFFLFENAFQLALLFWVLMIRFQR